MRQEQAHIFAGQCNTAFGRFVAIAGEMDENGTAVIRAARPMVPIGLDHQIIEMIVPPQPFMAIATGQFDKPVIGP